MIPSVTNTMAVIAAAVCAFLMALMTQSLGAVHVALAGACVYVLLVALWEGAIMKSWASALERRKVRSWSWGLYGPKQLAVLLLLGSFYLLLTSLPLFLTGKFRSVASWMPDLVAICLVVSPLYISWVMVRQKEAQDDYWYLGQALLGRPYDRRNVIDLLLSWGIKALFAPMMAAYLVNTSGSLIQFDWASWWSSPDAVYRGVWRLVAYLDLIMGAAGYLITLRVLGTHVRSVSRDPVEWAVTLACYWPLWPIIYGQIAYVDEVKWYSHMDIGGPIWWIWVVLLIIFKLLWLVAGLAHGIRFSNLTHRGIITTGLFRWFVHPSYTFKVLGYWFLLLPFLHPEHAVHHTLALTFVTWLYWMRGKTEERRLSADPIYRAYLERTRAWQSSCLRAFLGPVRPLARCSSAFGQRWIWGGRSARTFPSG